MRSIALKVAMLALGSSTAAQGHAEIGGGLAASLGGQTIAYNSTYLPLFASATHSGTASQDLAIDTGASPVIWGSVAWFPRPKVGVEFATSFRHASLAGTSTPYTVSLKYFAAQPPDFVLRQYQIDASTQWPAIDGHMTEVTLAGSLAGYAGDVSRAALRLSGGLAFISVSGSFGPLGYSQYWLGGHSVVFSDQYQLTMKTGRNWTTGFEGNAEIVHAFGPHMLVSVGGRVLIAPAIDAAVTIESAEPPSGAMAFDPAAAEQALSAPPFHWRTSQARISAGLRTRF